jgi:hypothetical protein
MTLVMLRRTAALALVVAIAGCGIGNGHVCGPPHEGPCDVSDEGVYCGCINYDSSQGPREECGDPGEHGGDTCTPATIKSGMDIGCCAEADYPALNRQCRCSAGQPPSSCALIGPDWVPISSCAINGTLSSPG